MVCGVAVRGGAPGTRETDLLRPENTVDRVHAVLLTGGSAFGLDAAGGVMRWLEEHGHGWPVGTVARVPIVPAAVLFDLWLGDALVRPDASTGYAACAAANGRAPAQGSVGAGLGASFDKRQGLASARKGGIGTASLQDGGFTVGALVAVNALGAVLDEHSRPIQGAGLAAWLSAWAATPGTRPTALPDGPADLPGTATTIGVVATDAPLSKAQATQLAQLAHHGLSRAVSPIGVNDGDSLFALALGETPIGTGGAAPDTGRLGALAAEAVSRAIRNAVRAAAATSTPSPT